MKRAAKILQFLGRNYATRQVKFPSYECKDHRDLIRKNKERRQHQAQSEIKTEIGEFILKTKK